MKFAAGLTLSGVVGFIVLEVLKLLLPTLAAAIVGFLAILMKIILISFVLIIVAGGLGLAYFLYKRAQGTQEVEA